MLDLQNGRGWNYRISGVRSLAKKQDKDNGQFERLKAAIRDKNTDNLYFFHGEEQFLMSHYLEKLRKNLLDELTESFNYHRFNTENFDLRSFADAVENLPMMAEHTLIQVEDIDPFKLPEQDRQHMAEILSDIPEYCTVVFVYITATWNPDGRLKKISDAVNQHGTVVEFARQEPRDLIPWIGRHFANRGKRISNDLCNYLIEITGGTMTALSGEIDKICAYSGADVIAKSDIDAVVEPVMDALVYQMTDYLGQGQYARGLDKLHQLLKMQNEPLSILGAIGGHFRRISTARTLLDHGKQVGDFMKLTGQKPYPSQKAMDMARRFSPKFCAVAAELVLETDRQMKTSFDDHERLLELLILRLAQEAGRG